MALKTDRYQPGRRVRVIQQMPHRDQAWASIIEGVITRYRQAKTGSWFAHAKDDQLWLDRLELRLDDGEITILNLDQYTTIEPIDDEEAAAAPPPVDAAAPSDRPPDAG
jgi:hypothetical protein